MSRNRFRQIARLERLADPYLDYQRRIELTWQQKLRGVVGHAAVLAVLIRHGDPKIGEPLSDACKRVECSAWRECVEKFPFGLKEGHRAPRFEPYDQNSVALIGMQLRHAVIATFRGSDEREKLDAAFAAAPPWLIWFTFGDYTGRLLDLKIPDLSSVTGFARSEANFKRWFGLPCDAFEPRPWPNGLKNATLARTDLNLVRPPTQRLDSQMTPREQKRARAIHLKHTDEHTEHWPDLLPAKYLAMPPDEVSKLLELNSRSNRHPGPGARAKFRPFG